MDDFLEQLLADSLTGRVVPKFELPTETQLNSRHAELARLIREQRSFSLVPFERNEDERAE
jgi:hypothetical protein